VAAHAGSAVDTEASSPASLTDASEGKALTGSVLFVALARGLGGSTRSLATVMSHLKGRARCVLAAPDQGPFVALIDEESLGDGRIALPGPRNRALRRLSRVGAALRLCSWTVRHRRELTAIHANGPEELNVAALAAMVSGVRLVVWSHARDVSPWSRGLSLVQRKLLGRRLRWAAVSVEAAGVLAEAGIVDPDEVAIVPNPIDPAEVCGEKRVEATPPRIGYLGSDATYKGFRMLPEVVARIPEGRARWLLFTNERSSENGAIWEQLRSLTELGVEIRGKQSDVRAVYEQCDIVFVPSLDESFGRVVAEAMMNGIPVIASDLPPLRRLIGDDEAGLLFEPGDAAAATNALSILVSDPKLRRELGAAGRSRAKIFDPQSVVETLESLYGLKRERVS
jgi:glycosyltransferase involved in cell wall biosynthesis